MVYLNRNSGQAGFPSPFLCTFLSIASEKGDGNASFRKNKSSNSEKGVLRLLKVGSKTSKCTNWADGNTFADQVVSDSP